MRRVGDAVATLAFIGCVTLACLVLAGLTDRIASDEPAIAHPAGCICAACPTRRRQHAKRRRAA
jgi:hypothetical protein